MRKRRWLCGSLAVVLSAAAALLLPWRGTPAIETDYRGIRLGMTEQEVRAILGEPLAEGGKHRPFGDSVRAVTRRVIDQEPAGAALVPAKARHLHWWDGESQLGIIVFLKADGTVMGKTLMSVTPASWFDGIVRRFGL